jgi:hypothetical protein
MTESLLERRRIEAEFAKEIFEALAAGPTFWPMPKF